MSQLLSNFDLTVLDFWMILFSGVMFTFFWKSLAVDLFRPIMEMLNAREAATVGAAERAIVVDKNAEEIAARYETGIQEAKFSALLERSKVIAETRQVAASVIEDAKNKARTIVEERAKNTLVKITQLQQQEAAKVSELRDLVIKQLGVTLQ